MKQLAWIVASALALLVPATASAQYGPDYDDGAGYDEDYYGESPTTDPQGPTRGTYRVARGGSFEGASAMNVRAAIRMPLKSSARRDNVGFRCGR